MVYAYFENADVASMVTVISAGAGLVTRTGEGGIEIIDPATLPTPVETWALLSEDAMQDWRAFALRYPGDEALPNGYYATASLQGSRGDLSAAVTEFKLVASQYPRAEAVASAGLLAGAELLMKVSDYAGAIEMLNALIDGYPRSADVDDAHLALGRAQLAAGASEQGLDTLKKAAHLEFDPEVTRQAILLLGRTYCKRGQYEDAESWLRRYDAGFADTPEIAEVCLLLGRCRAALGRSGEAFDALMRAWQCDAQGPIGMEALIAMAEIHLERDEYLSALNVLETAGERVRGGRDGRRLALIKARVFRRMCLGPLAIQILRRELDGGLDESETAEVYLELARAYARSDRPGDALNVLSEGMLKLSSPKNAARLQLEAARVYMRQGKLREAGAFARRVLAGGPDDTRQEALDMMAKSFAASGDHLRAALCFAGVWEDGDTR